jgi:hypothetical protein
VLHAQHRSTDEWQEVDVAPASITSLQMDEDGLRLIRVNATAPSGDAHIPVPEFTDD